MWASLAGWLMLYAITLSILLGSLYSVFWPQ